jgi:hypothetical protein
MNMTLVKLYSNDGKELDRLMMTSIPRIGENMYFQYASYEVLDVRYHVEKKLDKPPLTVVDIFIDYEA